MGEFESGHLELIKDLGIQSVKLYSDDHHSVYNLVPEENIIELKRRLILMSCGVKGGKIDNEQYYSASKFCKLCSAREGVWVLYAGNPSEGGSMTFYGFPREIYNLVAIANLQPNKYKEVLKTYLKKLGSDLENKCLEGLASPNELVWWEGYSGFERKDGLIKEMLRSLPDFLKYLEGVTKKIQIPNSYMTHDFEFTLCSGHNSKKNLSHIEKELIEKIVSRFMNYDIELHPRDLNIEFKEKKIFNLGKLELAIV